MAKKDEAKKKPVKAVKRTTTVQINNTLRYIVESDNVMKLETEVELENGTREYRQVGWYSDIASLLSRAIVVQTLERLRKKEKNDMKDLIKAFTDTRQEITQFFKTKGVK